MSRWSSKSTAFALATALALSVPAGAAAQDDEAPEFDMTVGVLMSFTGAAANAGPPWDKAARIGVDTVTAAIEEAGLSDKLSINAVTEDDGSTNATASEATTKLIKIDNASVILGPCCSGVTVAIATAITIPEGVPMLTIGTSPTITALEDEGTVFRTVPSDSLQGQVLAQAVFDALGEGATVNIGARNDAYGTGLSSTFTPAFEALGGTVGTEVLWNPDATTFDTEAQELVAGEPDGWVFFEFTGTWPQIQPALERTGAWDPAVSFGGDTFNKQATTPAGMRGTIATVEGGTGFPFFKAIWDEGTEAGDDIEYFGSIEPQAFDNVILSFLAALNGGSSDPAVIAENLPLVANGGTQYGPDQLADAIAAVIAGEDIDYIGATGPADFDENGDTTVALFDVWLAGEDGASEVISTVEF
jgi:ABC-type branched-subunit amino acid transport system substrate-binding protein